MTISTERRNEIWERAQVNGRTDDDLYARLLEQERESTRDKEGGDEDREYQNSLLHEER